MSKYTSEVYEIIKSLTYNNDTTVSIYDKIELSLPLIFDFDYPIWSEDYKRILEKKIIMHYFKKEICCETFELWQLFLNERLNLIMPYYNELYLSTLPEYDITKDFNNNTTTIASGTDNDVTNGSNNSTMGKIASNNSTINGVDTGFNTGDRVEYKVPQAKNGDNTDYASFLETNKADNTNTSDGTNNVAIVDNTTNTNTIDGTNNKTTTATNTSNSSGNNAYIGDLILKHRQSILNIDNMVIDELYDLFMLIY